MTDAERELPTGPHHEVPDFVGQPPSAIPGAPSPLNQLLDEIRAERAEVRAERVAMTKLVERVEGAAGMLTEAIDRLLNHDARLVSLEGKATSLKAWNQRLEDRVAELEQALNRGT